MYINQFFGGIGGEDKAGYEPSVEEGPVGPGNVILSCLKDAEITHTIICGDNFMTGHRDEAIERMDQFLEGIEFDLFLAGPAFQSGRYGMSCGEICKYITEKYHVTAITSMNEENPGVAAYAKTPDVYIMRGSKSAVRMRQDASAMAGLAAKVLSGEEILWAEHHRRRIPSDRAYNSGIRHTGQVCLSGHRYRTRFLFHQKPISFNCF